MEITVTIIDAGTIKPDWLQERAKIDIIVPPEARIHTPITVLHLQGDLDGSGYMTLLETIQQQGNVEAPRMILDFTGVNWISNSGLLGLYMAGSLLQGEPIHDQDGYEVTGRMRSAIEDGQPLTFLHVAALNEELASILESTGLSTIVTIYPTLEDAISRFPTR